MTRVWNEAPVIRDGIQLWIWADEKSFDRFYLSTSYSDLAKRTVTLEAYRFVNDSAQMEQGFEWYHPASHDCCNTAHYWKDFVVSRPSRSQRTTKVFLGRRWVRCYPHSANHVLRIEIPPLTCDDLRDSFASVSNETISCISMFRLPIQRDRLLPLTYILIGSSGGIRGVLIEISFTFLSVH